MRRHGSFERGASEAPEHSRLSEKFGLPPMRVEQLVHAGGGSGPNTAGDGASEKVAITPIVAMYCMAAGSGAHKATVVGGPDFNLNSMARVALYRRSSARSALSASALQQHTAGFEDSPNKYSPTADDRMETSSQSSVQTAATCLRESGSRRSKSNEQLVHLIDASKGLIT